MTAITLTDINDRRLREHLAGRMTLADLAAGLTGIEPYQVDLAAGTVRALPRAEYLAAVMRLAPAATRKVATATPKVAAAAPDPVSAASLAQWPTCEAAQAAYEAARPDISARGPDSLRDLLRATDDLLARNPHWSTCWRAARYRSVLSQWQAQRTAGAAAEPDQPIDLVVPLGTGSRHSDLELRYLLRSALANLRGLRTIHLIGPRRPAWLADHPQIRWHDWRQTTPKNHDIVAKFLHAATLPEVTATFVASCDDWLFLRPVDMAAQAACVAPTGVLSDNQQGTSWQRACAGTRQVLLAASRPVRFYDAHVPTVMTQSGWLAVAQSIAWRSVPGHAVWSLYHNTAGVHGPARDHRAYGGWHSGQAPKSVADVEQTLAGKLFARYNDRGFNDHTRAWLAARFPDPAPWETQAGAGGPQAAAGASAVFCAFNQPFADYAAAMVHSVLATCPGWIVHAYATNVSSETLSAYPWNDPRVTVHPETRIFSSIDDERFYMNSRRFIRYQDVFRSGSVAVAVMLDVDQIVVRPLDVLRGWLDQRGADVGLVERPRERELRRRIRACTVACRVTPASLRFWDEYQRHLPAEPTWWADQLALIGAKAAVGPGVAFMGLAERNYSSFRLTNHTYILVTSTTDKAKRSPDWASAYRAASDAVRSIAQATQTATVPSIGGPSAAAVASHTAAVYVIFGDGPERHAAMARALDQTAKTVVMPGHTIILELSDTATYAHAMAGVSGLTYRHLTVPTRAIGVWQKENLWEIARGMLAAIDGVRYAAFVDADVTPHDPSWFAQIEAAHASGIKVMQPWCRCTDTAHADIGGFSDSWLRQHTGRGGAQSGFAWSFDLRWLESIGGFICVEPLGGGDSLLRNIVYDPATGTNPEALHMRAIVAAAQVPRQPPYSLAVDLTHHSHGPRDNRQYHLRYRVARLVTDDLMALYERHPTGVLVVREGPKGDAWLRMLAERRRWQPDDESIRALWSECQRSVTPPEVTP
jgi:hypothetical protein